MAAFVDARVGPRHLLLLTDFDGTLAELTPTPDEAVLSDDVREALEEVAALPTSTTGVVSGRRLVDVGQRVGAMVDFVGGLHGLEITGPDCAFHHYALDEVAGAIDVLREAATRELAWCPGLLLEDKGYALTCHVRRCPPELADRAIEEFEALAEPYLEGRTLRLLTGAKAVELLPAVDWHKGRAAQWIRARVETRLGAPVGVVYLGDDRTDEDAFDALGADDAVIGVGPRPHTHLIDWRLEGPAAVGKFFGELVRRRRTLVPWVQ